MASQEQARPRKRPSIWRWVGLALVIHAEIGLVLGLLLYFFAPRQAEIEAQRREAAAAAEPISVSSVDEDTARKIIADMEKQEEKAKAAVEEKEKNSPEAPGQVVDIARPRDERRPEEARFAAEYDSWVEKETKKFGKFDPNSRQRHEGGVDESKPSAATASSSGDHPASPGALAMRLPTPRMLAEPQPSRSAQPGLASERPSSEEEMRSDPEGAFAPSGNTGRKRVEQAEPNEDSPSALPGGSASQFDLRANPGQLAKALGSGTQDHLVDVDEGGETALRAKQWKFASFFNQVKSQVRDHWKPAEEYARRDPTGKIYGSDDRYTLLQVKLKPDGWLSSVSLSHTSGLDFLDEIAMDAFREAQPFLNPPRALVEQEKGNITFQFGFFFEVSGSPKMRVFRNKSM